MRWLTRGIALVAVMVSAGGCFSKNAIVVDDLLEPLALPIAWVPKEEDLAAARLARAALASDPRAEGRSRATGEDPRPDPRVEGALAELETLSEAKGSKIDEHLLPLAIDLRNSTLDDAIAYRRAARVLENRRGLDPRIEGRLERAIADDPIRLARKRVFDGWHRLWARTFNAVMEPLGNSLITGFVLAPYQLANSIIHYFADFTNNEALSLTSRQALALRKEFLRAHPNTQWTESLKRKVERDSILLERTLARRRIRAADKALDAASPELALRHARGAIALLTPHPSENGSLRKEARDLEDVSARRSAEKRRLKALSLLAVATQPATRESEVALSMHLLAGPVEFTAVEPVVERYRAAGGTDDRVEFVRTLALKEGSHEKTARAELHRLGDRSPFVAPMARHARVLVENDWQNPYGAFVRLRKQGVRKEIAWRLAGEWVNRTRYPNIWTPVAYLIDLPTIALTIVMAPIRAIMSPWTGGPDFQRGSALAAYRYLAMYPNGGDQPPVIDWLFDYETDQKHWGRALRLADFMPRFDPSKRADLVEKTAESRIASVEKLERRDNRSSILKGAAREFPDSEKGQEAGMLAREELMNASPQQIRITRSFLIENPTVAGPSGVGLNPRLLNGNPRDGELHPDGIVLRGGRTLEILLQADGKDDEAPPDPRVRRVSKRRLTQLSTELDEAVRRNSLIDIDARFAADANRDLYLERASLGLTEEADLRATAESRFVYQSLRERYGLVRGRESILPFDLVFRGSLADFSLGAFPRWRPPKSTPDAFLYR